MGALLRFFLACAALPACWGLLRALAACFVAVSDGGELRVETLALLGGMALFAVWWFVSPHPVRTYVLGHELTHALWGLAFGGRASGLKVGSRGGSVVLPHFRPCVRMSGQFFVKAQRRERAVHREDSAGRAVNAEGGDLSV